MKRKNKLIQSMIACMLLFTMLCVNIVGSASIVVKAAGTSSAITFIALGKKGNATLVETEVSGQKRYGLIDAGYSDSNVAEYIIDKINKDSSGRKYLDFVIVSHMHQDHAGGIPEVISTLCDSKTTLYIKDASTIKDPQLLEKYNRIIKSAKDKAMPIGKIKPELEIEKGFVFNSEADISKKVKSAHLRTKLDVFTKNADGSYSSSGKQSNIIFGEFEITLFNGQNWNKYINPELIGKDENGYIWDENVNSVTALLKYTGKTVYRTYLNSDLGENSKQQYSQTISELTASAIGSQVSVYQVAHHGFYNSLNKETASKLNFKHAIVTNSYEEIVKKGIAKAENLKISGDAERLSFATNTLKAFLDLENLQKVYFTDGTNLKNETAQYRIINKLKDKVVCIDNNKEIIKNGDIVVHFEPSFNVIQGE